jgi:uncharacterized protein YndB with AHSA1/START domain
MSMIDPTVLAGLQDRWHRSEQLLDAPPERVHRAWSDPEELAAWLCRAVEGSLLVGARSMLVFSDRQVPIDVMESDPPGRFRFRWAWRPDVPATVVTVAIHRYGYGSRVVVEDGPFDLSMPGVADTFAFAATTWGFALANLRARVDFGADLRRPVR